MLISVAMLFTEPFVYYLVSLIISTILTNKLISFTSCKHSNVKFRTIVRSIQSQRLVTGKLRLDIGHQVKQPPSVRKVLFAFFKHLVLFWHKDTLENGSSTTSLVQAQSHAHYCWAVPLDTIWMGPTANCDCGACEETAEHIIISWPL